MDILMYKVQSTHIHNELYKDDEHYLEYIKRYNSIKISEFLNVDKFHETYVDNYHGKLTKTTAYVLTEEELNDIIREVRTNTIIELQGGN